MKSIILKSDSYKFTHAPQYPEGTTKVYSYLESRGGKFDNTVFYGLQYLLKKHFEGIVVTKQDVDKANKIIDNHIGQNIFNYEGWMRIVNTHGGKIPIRIKAAPEGTVIKTNNVLMTIENTDYELPWITNFCESILLQIWYPITVATLSREIKKNIIKYLKMTTSYNKEEIQNICKFSLNDFGYRGSSSDESASIGGSAHIVNFSGSDNISAIDLIMTYYNTNDMLAFSIPASEHSTITSWTEPFEVKAFENMLDKFPNGNVACVSDSFDIIRSCRDHWGTTLRDKILNRDGTLVIRPDSGDPVQTLKQVFRVLWDKFGGTFNSKGFKVIDPHVRVIQGDGVNYESIIEILDMMIEEGFSVENIVFGMGGALLQKVDRDTQKFAIKCSSIVINGKEVDVQKNPIEINEFGERVQSFKKSKAGRMKLIRTGYDNSDEYETVTKCNDFSDDILVDIFENGKILREWTFQEVRERAEIEIQIEEFINE